MPKQGNRSITRRAMIRAIGGAARASAAGCITPMPGTFFIRQPGVPFDATPMDVILAMLRLVDLKQNSEIYNPF